MCTIFHIEVFNSIGADYILGNLREKSLFSCYSKTATQMFWAMKLKNRDFFHCGKPNYIFQKTITKNLRRLWIGFDSFSEVNRDSVIFARACNFRNFMCSWSSHFSLSLKALKITGSQCTYTGTYLQIRFIDW